MLAEVNREACIRCGLCASLCPEVFTLPDNGDAAEATHDDITQRECQIATREAADSCPTAAIIVR